MGTEGGSMDQVWLVPLEPLNKPLNEPLDGVGKVSEPLNAKPSAASATKSGSVRPIAAESSQAKSDSNCF